MKAELRSFTDPDIFYSVDTEGSTCTCPAFASDKWCKHLEAFGRYRPRKVTLSARPSFAQALSGVVKCIRIRNIEEGVYWLQYCWGFRGKLPGSQFRIVRRLLIGSAEDGHSIAVMEKLAENFTSLLAKDVEFSRVAAELVRICKLPNWWDPVSGGPDYIRCGMLARRRRLYDHRPVTLDLCVSEVQAAIESQDRIGALDWVIQAVDIGSGSGLVLADALLRLAVKRNHEPAQRLLKNVYLRHLKPLHDDNNFLGQAAWLMAGGHSPVIDQIEPVTHGEIRMLIEHVHEMPSHVVPRWCCDGVHCAGNDIRYLGTFARMFAVCQQFRHYQRVSPHDPWPEDEFYALDGLIFR